MVYHYTVSCEVILKVKRDKERKKSGESESSLEVTPCSIQLIHVQVINHLHDNQFLASDSPPLLLRAEAWWEKDSIQRTENDKNKPTEVTILKVRRHTEV